jgi:hypothetical protein
MPSRIKSLGAGALAGVVAALLMTLVLLILRSQFGAPTPSELTGERIVPLLSVDRFIRLLTQFGGFNNLKKMGFGSVLVGQISFDDGNEWRTFKYSEPASEQTDEIECLRAGSDEQGARGRHQ